MLPLNFSQTLLTNVSNASFHAKIAKIAPQLAWLAYKDMCIMVVVIMNAQQLTTKILRTILAIDVLILA